MKKLLFILLSICACMQAQVYCPMRIVPGDPRNKGQEEQMRQADRQRRIAETEAEAMHTPGIGTLTLPPRVLVLMVQFSDYSFTTDKAHADSLFNAVTPMQSSLGHWYDEKMIKHGSVASYFNDQSLGQYRPQFDVVGPITVSKGYNKYSNNEFALTKEACSLVNSTVDFTKYDADGDGYIDLVFVYYAGFGKNDANYIDERFKLDVSNLVWPHYKGTSTSNPDYDGKRLRAYECSNEMDGFLSVPDTLVPAGCGVLVHEFSHGMGLPDIYSGSGDNQKQYMGDWDLMDYGCYNWETYVPAPYTGYERWFCQWVTPKMMNEVKNDTLRPIAASGDFGVITASGEISGPHSNNEYWIIENHQKDTKWEQGVPGNGMILYRIKYHSNWGSSANGNATNDGYILRPADGTLRVEGSVGKQGDCYPYNELDSIILTQASNYPITAIKQETDGTITFKVCGGVPGPAALERERTIGLESKNAMKIYHNGTIYIRRGNTIYTLTGNETHLL